MSKIFKRFSELFAVPMDKYNLDDDDNDDDYDSDIPAGEGLGFRNNYEEVSQVDWSDLRSAKLLSHQCIFAQYVDGSTGVLVNVNSPMIHFLDLIDAMIAAREDFHHGTPEIYKPSRERFLAPKTPEGLIILSVDQKKQINRQMELWESGSSRVHESDLLDIATEYVIRGKQDGKMSTFGFGYDGGYETDEEYYPDYEDYEADDLDRSAFHKKNDDIYTGETDEESGPSKHVPEKHDVETIIGADIASPGYSAVATAAVATTTTTSLKKKDKDLVEVVHHNDYTTPDTIPERSIISDDDNDDDDDDKDTKSKSSRSFNRQREFQNDIVFETYVHASLSEYDIYCIFSSMELSDAMYMTALSNWISSLDNEKSLTFVDNPMQKFREYLDDQFPVMIIDTAETNPCTGEMSSSFSMHGTTLKGPISEDITPPRNTRMALFSERESIAQKPSNGFYHNRHTALCDPDTKEVNQFRNLLGFDPALYYMRCMSEEYKLRASPMIEIVALLDSVLNGVSDIIDGTREKYETPHAHYISTEKSGKLPQTVPTNMSEGCIMPDTIEIEWKKLKHIEDMINKYRRWTKQVTKAATTFEKTL